MEEESQKLWRYLTQNIYLFQNKIRIENFLLCWGICSELTTYISICRKNIFSIKNAMIIEKSQLRTPTASNLLTIKCNFVVL